MREGLSEYIKFMLIGISIGLLFVGLYMIYIAFTDSTSSIDFIRFYSLGGVFSVSGAISFLLGLKGAMIKKGFKNEGPKLYSITIMANFGISIVFAFLLFYFTEIIWEDSSISFIELFLFALVLILLLLGQATFWNSLEETIEP